MNQYNLKYCLEHFMPYQLKWQATHQEAELTKESTHTQSHHSPLQLQDGQWSTESSITYESTLHYAISLAFKVPGELYLTKSMMPLQFSGGCLTGRKCWRKENKTTDNFGPTVGLQGWLSQLSVGSWIPQVREENRPFGLGDMVQGGKK